MPLILADRVRDTTTTTGTGTVTLSGTAPTGYQNFSVIGNGNTTYYTINAGSQWEVGIGTYSSTGPTLARNTVLESSNANALVDFAAGTKDVFVTYPSDEAVYQDGAVIAAGTAVLGVANGGTGLSSTPANGAIDIGNGTGFTRTTLTAGTNISITNGAGSITINATDQFAGTVTSVAASGGTTGMTFSGSPITTSGTLTLGGTLAVANGGTGVTTSTGTGSVVLNTSPTLVTPTLGAASATSIANGLGAVGTPSFSFTGDTNTGMWSPAADTLAFSEGGVEAMRITSAGNVGIGTSSPSQRLDVNGNVNVSGTGQFTAATYCQIGVTSGTVQGQFAANAGGSVDIRAVSNHPMYLFTNNTERMRITDVGNVGIGTSAPVARLDVSGTSRNRLDLSSTTASWFTTNPAANAYAEIAHDALAHRWLLSSSNAMVLNTSGNVGIGTSSPGARLHLENAGSTVAVRLGITASNQYLDIFRDASTGFSVYNAAQADPFRSHVWQLGGSEAMRINSAGNVGIGTSAPSSRLSVAYSSTSFADGLAVTNSATGTGAWSRISVQAGINYAYTGITNTGELYLFNTANAATVFGTNNAERMRIDSSGNVGIGTSAPGSRLTVVGGYTDLGGLRIAGSAVDALNNIFLATGELSLSTGSGSITFKPGTTERMRIDSSGNLLVGSSASPSGSGTNLQVSSSVAARLWLTATGNRNFYFESSSGNALQIVDATAGAERMRIDSSGRVGVGTSAPIQILQVTTVGQSIDGPFFSSSTGPWMRFIPNSSPGAYNGIVAAGTNSFIFSGGSANAGTLTIAPWADGTSGVVINASGSVGIGANLPGATGISPFLAIGANNAGIGSASANNIVVVTNNAERMRIGSNGGVAIGNTGTDASLHIQQAYGGYDRLTQIAPGIADKNAFNIMAAKNSGGTDLWWSWGVRNDNVWVLQQGVNYSLNSGLGFYYDSGGQAYKSGGGSWAASSDVRIKTNILPISDAASRIMALKPSAFDYRVPEAHQGRVSDRGFIAQDFEEVYPHSVSESVMVADAEKAFITEEGKIKAISLNNDFFADLVALVQEQQTTINDLRARVAQLEGN